MVVFHRVKGISRCLYPASVGVAPDHSLRDQGESFWCSDHVVKTRVHEIQGALKRTALEMTPPNLQRQPLRGFPRVGVEAGRPGEAFDPQAGLREVGDGTLGLKRHGVQWNGHV